MQTQEHARLTEKTEAEVPVPAWQKWGPYVSERSWGTVREDYSPDGEAWSYFPFDLAKSKVYRWGDDAIAGWCDRYQVLLFAPVFWNGKDPILKERLFGLASAEGNHGEDVKECYFYLDGTPTHSYMKFLYKYPQAAFPYDELREVNQKRSAQEPEYELVDTGVFADNRYFDIFIEYAKTTSEDICIRIEAINRGDKPAPLHLLPHLWFRNSWAWGDTRLSEPKIIRSAEDPSALCLVADDATGPALTQLPFDYRLGKRYLYGPAAGKPLFTNNEDSLSKQKHLKDAFHHTVIENEDAHNPDETGTKACLHYKYESVPAKGSVVLCLRLSSQPVKRPLEGIQEAIDQRKKEADEFYASIHPKGATPDECAVQRQALAGMLWSKQIYLFDVNQWLEGDNTYHRPPESRTRIRNIHWRHLNSMRILSMPDKWEYPWFAAWDLAFHCITLAIVDLEFAKDQLWLLLFDQFQHPNGAIPAYEWEFSDLNPPVQAWAAIQIYEMEKKQNGKGDEAFLRKCFLKLLMNFSWWVNKVDTSGNNVFEGGFLGLDNITLVDRSKSFMGGATLRQSDGTGWMAMFCLNLMRIALELSKAMAGYEAMATKFFQHFVYIADAMKKMGNKNYGLWNDQDHFFYDVLSYPDGRFSEFRVRSLVGIIPLFAVEIITEEEMALFPEFRKNFEWFIKHRKEITQDCVIPIQKPHKAGYILTLVDEDHLKGIMQYVWNPDEFLSNYGLRSLSKFHEQHPFSYQNWRIGYEPAEAVERLKGGNSNWRGPIWSVPNYMITVSLLKFAKAFNQDFKLSAGSEQPVDLQTMAKSFADRVISIYTRNAQGVRPVFGQDFPYANDPNWNSYPLFYEYYHGDTGKGLGASHQTGWSGLVANLIAEWRVA
jgi:hypothetical protein